MKHIFFSGAVCRFESINIRAKISDAVCIKDGAKHERLSRCLMRETGILRGITSRKQK